MDLNNLPVFRMMSGKMKWLAERQTVLAKNVSNSDTPRYRPKELKEVDFTQLEKANAFRVALARTDPRHLAGSGAAVRFDAAGQRNPYETLPAGNAVVLEEQLAKVAENRHDYALMTQLYRKHIQMFRIALGQRGQ